MKISKYIISVSSSLFSSIYELNDEDDQTISSIRVSGLSSQLQSFQYLSDQYTIDKESIWSSIHHISKNGQRIATIKNQSLWTSNLLILTNNHEYLLKSNLTYNKISILQNDIEVGKISRKIRWLNTSFGVAINYDGDHIVFVIAVIIQHLNMKAQMAA